MPGPKGALTVRVNDGASDRLVTRHVRGLRFRKTAPGGHHSASMRLLMPAGAFRDLGPADKLWVYDARTSRCVWEGYTENPGTEDGPGGQAFDLSALGGQTLAQDNARAVVFLDRSLDQLLWIRNDNASGATTGIEDDSYKMQFLSGQPIGASSRVGLQYHGLVRAGQTLASVRFGVEPGKVDTNYGVELTTRTPGQVAGGTSTIVFQVSWSSTAANDTYGAAAPADFSVATVHPTITLIRLGGATNVADDLTYQRIFNVRIRASLMDRTGATAAVESYEHVYAHEVVNHLLGAMLPMFDGAGATVETATYAIPQLAYHSAVTPQRILDDLSIWEPDFLWEVLEGNAEGKHRFNYRAWPTDARYEISVRDGYSAPGGVADLCNRIVVNWTDTTGGKRSTVVTSTVPELGSRVRDAQPITLPQGMGSASNAQRVGEMVLASKATPPKAARAVVRRPILDRDRGQTVMPWEIEPGYLVAVRETGDLLRLTEMDYDDDAVATTLTLGTPQRTIEQMLAGLGLSQGIAA